MAGRKQTVLTRDFRATLTARGSKEYQALGINLPAALSRALADAGFVAVEGTIHESGVIILKPVRAERDGIPTPDAWDQP